MYLTIALVVLIFAFISEGFHDYYNKVERSLIYKLQYTDKVNSKLTQEKIDKYRARWHTANWVFYFFFIISFILFGLENIELNIYHISLIIAYIGVTRALLLNTTHNILDNKKIHYLSDSGSDKIIKNIFGELVYFILNILISISIFTYLITR